MINNKDFTESLRRAGVERGATVFCHSNIAFFGPVEKVSSISELADFVLTCFVQALGPTGRLVLPAFTYSFGKDKTNKVFDPLENVSSMSSLTSSIIASGSFNRSLDPMLSVVSVGHDAASLVADIGNICFGPNSIWSRLYQCDALICNLNLDSGSTFLHWVERELNVPYRHDIHLRGSILSSGLSSPYTVIYTGRLLDKADAEADFRHYHNYCIQSGVSKAVQVGRGQIVSQSCRQAKSQLEHLISTNPFILTVAHANYYSFL